MHQWQCGVTVKCMGTWKCKSIEKKMFRREKYTKTKQFFFFIKPPKKEKNPKAAGLKLNYTKSHLKKTHNSTIHDFGHILARCDAARMPNDNHSRADQHLLECDSSQVCVTKMTWQGAAQSTTANRRSHQG